MERIFRNRTVHLALVVAVGILVYSNTFHIPFFLSADYVTENPFVKDISFPLEQLKQLNPDHYGLTRSRYIPYLTFAMNYKLHGFQVAGYHAVNIFFHLLNALFVYALVALTFKTPLLKESSLNAGLTALFAVLLFVAHPIQAEAVNWIWHGRAAVLTSFFYLGSLLAYIRGREEEDRNKIFLWHGIAFLSAILAMKCKENAITLPVMATLYEIVFFRDGLKSRFMRLLPLALTMLIIPAARIMGTGGSLDQAGKAFLPVTGQEMTRLEYLFTQFKVLANYLHLFFWPADLTVFREWEVSRSLMGDGVLLSGLFLALLLSAAIFLLIRFRNSRPEISLAGFGIVWFFLAHSVESSIVPLSVLTADYRNYLPGVGIFISFTAIVSFFLQRFDRAQTRLLPLTMGALIIVLAGAAFARNEVWKTEMILARDVVENSPDSAQAHFIMSKAYKTQGMTAEAEREIDTAFRLDEAAHPGMAGVAIKPAPLSRKLSPGEVDAHFKTAVQLYGKGEMDTALQELQGVLAAAPDHAEAHYYSALILHSRGMNKEAAAEYLAALKLKPGFVAAHSDYAALLAQMERFPEAIGELKTALRYKPDYPEAHRFLGMIYQDTGRLSDAVSSFRTAVRHNPDYADAHNNLGEAYLQMGDKKGAAAEFETVLRLKPEHEAARQNLARTVH